jgi:hypothetical protein
MRVELIYDADCPNVAAARSVLIEAFARTRTSARWREWERSAADTPAYARSYGSPTILVEGRDVAGVEPASASPNCRIYGDDGLLSRTPTVSMICEALRAASGGRRGRFRSVVASLPAVGVALLPKLTCPLCFPAYSALLGAAGLGFVDYTPYLLPATLAFLGVALGALAIGARRTRRLAPLALGLVSAGLVVAGKFVAESEWTTNAGIALLVASIFLSTWRPARRSAACPACVSGETPGAQPN